MYLLSNAGLSVIAPLRDSGGTPVRDALSSIEIERERLMPVCGYPAGEACPSSDSPKKVTS